MSIDALLTEIESNFQNDGSPIGKGIDVGLKTAMVLIERHREQLESQIAGQWISVETELPSSECLCVVYNAKSGGVMTSYFNGKDFSVVMIDWVKAENYCPVTHYIVLPTPPKGEN